jgi:hypothetical protein
MNIEENKLSEEAVPKPCALTHSQLVLGQAQKTSVILKMKV